MAATHNSLDLYPMHRVPASRPFIWLAMGWDSMMHSKGPSLAYGTLVALLGAMILGYQEHPLYIASAICAFLVVGPVIAAGICELSRRRDHGESSSFQDSLEAIRLNRAHLLAYGLAFLGVSAVVFLLSVISVPMIIDRHTEPGIAMRMSVRVAARDLPAMLIWAALIVSLVAFGFGTQLWGMIIVLPLLGHATWYAYRDIIEEE